MSSKAKQAASKAKQCADAKQAAAVSQAEQLTHAERTRQRDQHELSQPRDDVAAIGGIALASEESLVGGGDDGASQLAEPQALRGAAATQQQQLAAPAAPTSLSAAQREHVKLLARTLPVRLATRVVLAELPCELLVELDELLALDMPADEAVETVVERHRARQHTQHKQQRAAPTAASGASSHSASVLTQSRPSTLAASQSQSAASSARQSGVVVAADEVDRFAGQDGDEVQFADCLYEVGAEAAHQLTVHFVSQSSGETRAVVTGMEGDIGFASVVRVQGAIELPRLQCVITAMATHPIGELGAKKDEPLRTIECVEPKRAAVFGVGGHHPICTLKQLVGAARVKLTLTPPRYLGKFVAFERGPLQCKVLDGTTTPRKLVLAMPSDMPALPSVYTLVHWANPAPAEVPKYVVFTNVFITYVPKSFGGRTEHSLEMRAFHGHGKAKFA